MPVLSTGLKLYDSVYISRGVGYLYRPNIVLLGINDQNRLLHPLDPCPNAARYPPK